MTNVTMVVVVVYFILLGTKCEVSKHTQHLHTIFLFTGISFFYRSTAVRAFNIALSSYCPPKINLNDTFRQSCM